MSELPFTPGITWKIFTTKVSAEWPQSSAESWYLVPKTRYVTTSDRMHALGDNIESISELRGATFYKPFNASGDISNKDILV